MTATLTRSGALARSSAEFDHYRYSGYSATVPTFEVVLPGTTTIYLRRRVVAAAVFTVTMALLWVGAGKVLASRGGDPASVPTARPGATHTVEPGDTLWSIAADHRGTIDQATYVDLLIDLNGGSSVVRVGQGVRLP